MATSVLMPFPFFNDDDGTPIDGGYIYIGEYQLDPESNPKAAFWDAALTIPAAQPLRTRFGFIYRDGTPARVYVDGNYSIRTKDRNLVTVFTDLEPPTGNVILGTMALLDTGTGSTQFRTNAQNDARYILKTGFGPTFSGLTVSGNSALNGDVKSTPVGKRTIEFLPSFATGRVLSVFPGGTGLTNLGFSSVNNTGVITGQATTQSGDPMTIRRRTEIVPAVAAVNAVGGFNALGATGEGVLLARPVLGGGFDFKMRVGPGPGPTVSTCRARFGLSNFTSVTQPITDVEPSSILNAMFFGWDSTDTNCQIIYRGAGAATKIDLGASFAVPTTARSKLYDIRFFNSFDTNGVVEYEVTDIFTGATASGNFSHPSAVSTYFNPSAYVTAGGVSVAPGIVFCGMTLEYNE